MNRQPVDPVNPSHGGEIDLSENVVTLNTGRRYLSKPIIPSAMVPNEGVSCARTTAAEVGITAANLPDSEVAEAGQSSRPLTILETTEVQLTSFAPPPVLESAPPWAARVGPNCSGVLVKVAPLRLTLGASSPFCPLDGSGEQQGRHGAPWGPSNR